MCEFCEMIVVIRLFSWLKGAKWVVECGVCGWKLVLLCVESGVFEVGLFRFRLKKKGGTSHDVPMLKKILVDLRLDLPFCILSFGAFAVQR